ncbi:hypothetical protein GCM10022214_25970 [Actinomadura miaoliensis]|uniref:Uncharacterized protein n=1 Tax=Actinomadura miaoliensis TaxID=430685 RepID=A0ABP7VLS8_9ACTN
MDDSYHHPSRPPRATVTVSPPHDRRARRGDVSPPAVGAHHPDEPVQPPRRPPLPPGAERRRVRFDRHLDARAREPVVKEWRDYLRTVPFTTV